MLKPVLTEKSLQDAKEGKYTFWVDVDANKYQARKVIGDTFGVHVKKVRVAKKGPELKKSFRRGKIFALAQKKVVVTLAEKEKIDLFEEIKEK